MRWERQGFATRSSTVDMAATLGDHKGESVRMSYAGEGVVVDEALQ
jgi:hypothetical protein